MRTAITFALLIGAAFAAYASAERSQSVLRDFQRMSPCPSTGAARGKCPGWQRDHIIPLCAGGADEVWNLQWLTVQEHKEKTRRDVMHCRAARK